jgi:hypothetical protein
VSVIGVELLTWHINNKELNYISNALIAGCGYTAFQHVEVFANEVNKQSRMIGKGFSSS